MEVRVLHYDAFSNIPNMGNPAGVVFGGNDLTEDQMREVAAKVGFNETAFPLPSNNAELRIRYFTPGHEINLCGHATMATIYGLKTKGLLGDKMEFTIETKAGILPIRLKEENGLRITMRQTAPQFREFNGSVEKLASAMGIGADDIETELPILYGSTGTWTLLIPIKELATFQRMIPNNQRFPEILTKMPSVSIHPFCLKTYDEEAQMHARHFSSPFSGTIEDPVTGTASGVMGAYYSRYITNENTHFLQLNIEQGQEIGKNGKVKVTVTNGEIIEITGEAVYVNEFTVLI